MKLITKTGKEYNITWIGVATIDGALRFELIGVEPSEVFSVFTNREETSILTQDWEGQIETFRGFVQFKTIDMQPNGNVIVALARG